MDKSPGAGWLDVGEAAVAGAGMVVFALFAHSLSVPFAFSAAGLTLTAAALVRAVVRSRSPLILFGLAPVARKVALYVPVGALLGLALGLWYRRHIGAPALPEAFRGFALVAALIGSAEEVLYRGYVQGRVRRLGPVGAVACAALLHTAYKSVLFALPGEAVTINFPFIVTATFVGGLAFGVLRELSGNVHAPLAAHAAFDLVVYAELAEAPWWVWS
ncbi:MAG TPA: CPBP family intramembrane glutamic endopeptidase [Phycisphaerae bacterium]|nr:CPBP family intramembrane glutamic endopeptidase [Phycisphaerae bacterium]